MSFSDFLLEDYKIKKPVRLIELFGGDYTYMAHFSTFMNNRILDYVETEQ